MKPQLLYFISFIIRMLPVSRFFKLKNTLFNIAGLKIDMSARIYSNVKIYGNGILKIGKDTFIGHESIIISCSPAKIEIGNFVDIAPRVYIGTGSHEINPESNHIAGKGKSLSIAIGDGAWIGANSTILPGITIGEKVVIAAGSVVNNDIPSYTIAAGIPAKPIKKWDFEKRIWESFYRKSK